MRFQIVQNLNFSSLHYQILIWVNSLDKAHYSLLPFSFESFAISRKSCAIPSPIRL